MKTLTIEEAIEEVAVEIARENDYLIFLPPNPSGDIWMVWRNNEKGDRFYFGKDLKIALSNIVDHDPNRAKAIKAAVDESNLLSKIGCLCSRLNRGFSIKILGENRWLVELDGRGIISTAPTAKSALEWFHEELDTFIRRTLERSELGG